MYQKSEEKESEVLVFCCASHVDCRERGLTGVRLKDPIGTLLKVVLESFVLAYLFPVSKICLNTWKNIN